MQKSLQIRPSFQASIQPAKQNIFERCTPARCFVEPSLDRTPIFCQWIVVAWQCPGQAISWRVGQELIRLRVEYPVFEGNQVCGLLPFFDQQLPLQNLDRFVNPPRLVSQF